MALIIRNFFQVPLGLLVTLFLLLLELLFETLDLAFKFRNNLLVLGDLVLAGRLFGRFRVLLLTQLLLQLGDLSLKFSILLVELVKLVGKLSQS